MGFDYNRIKNPGYFRENRLDARSDHRYFRDDAEADAVASSFVHLLNGIWKFSYSKNPGLAPAGFEQPDFDCKCWDDITVPGHIQLKGYDAPQYVNIQYPWDGHEEIEPGEIPAQFNPVANYVKYFMLPESMAGERLYISFQGVESGFALWLNGSYVGYGSDGFTPSEFELTPYVREGENKLAVQVFKFTAGSWIEDQDFFRFSGIFRDVYLFTVPGLHIWDLQIDQELDDGFRSAELSAVMRLGSFSGGVSERPDGRVEARLLFGDKVVCEADAEVYPYDAACPDDPAYRADAAACPDDPAYRADAAACPDDPAYRASAAACPVSNSSGCAKIKLSVSSPELWSAESPNLYVLELKVFDGAGNLCEVVRQNAGFRRFELIDNIMHLNGRRIVFFGVNRHEFSCDSGRVLTREQMEYDVVTMKRFNINAVRTSHYPNDSYFYELCDRYGLYVIDEVNMESHGRWDVIVSQGRGLDAALPGDDPAWRDIVLDRVESLYRRDKNHPCVLIWSLGNESFGGTNVLEMARRFRALDRSRLVHYEGVHWDRRYPESTDIYSQMYIPAADLEAFLKDNRDKPAILCEYFHTMGNSGGAMHKYIDLMMSDPLFQGGFIWDFIDQSLVKKDRYGKEFQAYGGDFDDRPCDNNFCGNGILYGDRGLSPKMQTVKYNYQGIVAEVGAKKITVKNRNLFTSTAAYDCIIILERNGVELSRSYLETDVAPLSSGDYILPLEIPASPGEYAVTASFRLKEDSLWEKKGYEVAFGQYVAFGQHEAFGQHVGTLQKRDIPERAAPVKVIHGGQTFGVRGESFSAIFSKGLGGLVSYKYGGREMIKKIPAPNFWRAPTDNDTGNLMPARYAQWKIASLYGAHFTDTIAKAWNQKQNPSIEELDGRAAITYRYYLPTTPAAECEAEYTVTGDGTVFVRLTCHPKGLPPMPEFGMLFRLDADYENLEWFGMGPEETYIDRVTGAKLGIYRNKVADNMAKYLVPQECGNKVGVRYAKLTDNTGRGILFEGDGMEFSALPYTPHELENAMHHYELPQPHYTVVRVNLRQMGVGGDDSWGAPTLEEYLLPTDQKLSFTFSFRGI